MPSVSILSQNNYRITILVQNGKGQKLVSAKLLFRLLQIHQNTADAVCLNPEPKEHLFAMEDLSSSTIAKLANLVEAISQSSAGLGSEVHQANGHLPNVPNIPGLYTVCPASFVLLSELQENPCLVRLEKNWCESEHPCTKQVTFLILERDF